MSFFKWLAGDAPASKVQEVKSDAFDSKVTLKEDDGLILYAPISTEKNQIFEVALLTKTTTSYSLFRAKSKMEGEKTYSSFVYRLPQFVLIANEYFNVEGLQTVCDTLSENPSWSMAHLVCHFGLKKYLSNERIRQIIDDAEYQNNMTPLQLAVRSEKTDIVKEMLNGGLCNVNHLDKNDWSVYHYAAVTTKQMINLLTTKSIKYLNHYNSNGFTPLHLACVNDKPDCIKALILAGADTNLGICSKSKVFSVNTSDAAGNKLIVQDMKFGGTLLHWSSSRQVIESLIESGIDVNELNVNRRTALHNMVGRNHLECVVALLSYEAKIDLQDNEGNTALHIAVEKKFIPIIQCLIVFGCDVNMSNRDGKSPRHMVASSALDSIDEQILYILHSIGANRCPEINNNCPQGCNAQGMYNGKQPAKTDSVESRDDIVQLLDSSMSNLTISTTPTVAYPNSTPTNFIEETKNKFSKEIDAILGMFAGTTPKENKMEVMQKDTKGRGRLLCLDGGGIRGLILVQMLVEIENIAQSPISHMFDWIAGTSTGGILALGLGCGKTMRQLMCLYLRMKEQAFVDSRPYKSENLEALLKENLGANTVMADIKYPRIMVTAVMADRKPVDLHLFRNYKCAADILGSINSNAKSKRRVPLLPPEKQLVWKAARATGAAPSYFPASDRFLDGGLIANNPTLDAITEIHEYNMALKKVGREQEFVPISIVISLGTGLIPVAELHEINLVRPQSMADVCKLVMGTKELGTMLVDQATASDGRVVDRARAWCSMIGSSYLRFNPQMAEEIEMDEKRDQELVKMMWWAKAYMHANRDRIMEIIHLLK